MRVNSVIVLSLLFTVVFLMGCVGSPQKDAKKSALVCNDPYIRVGSGCCLDENQNSVCDEDEEAETTSKPSETKINQATTTIKAQATTVPTTTSPGAASSSTLKYACEKNEDCPEPTYGSKRCSGKNVVQDKTTFKCSKPATLDAKCIGSIKTETVEGCSERCVGGACVTEGGDATTSLNNCAWNNQECLDYCSENCAGKGMEVRDCTYDEDECKCSVSCGMTQTTTIPSTTIAGVTTVPGTTTTITYTTSCEGLLSDASNCDGDCDPACETCEPYMGTPCYMCKTDCSKLGSGWSSSVECNLNHGVLETNQNCGCYNCEEECPLDEGGVDYYRLQGCEGDCYSDLCRKVKTREPQSQYAECYKCYEPECGNGLIEYPDEECEVDADCLDYAYCDFDCLCQPDCIDYCDYQGVDGYLWINDGAAGSPAIGSTNQCSDWASQKLAQISQQCHTSCVASASYSYDGSYACCCVDWNSLPCANCPGQNPACPTQDACMATL